MLRRLLAALLLLGLLAGCNTQSVGDGVSFVVFNGNRYSGGVGGEFNIRRVDLTEIGAASEVKLDAPSNTVYALAGVNPEAVVILEPSEAGTPYLIFFRDGIGQPGRPMSEVVAGLCRYLGVRPPSCV